MLATDVKTQKIEPGPNFFMTDESFGGMCKRDRHNVSSYLFFNVRKFRTPCAKTLTGVTYLKNIFSCNNSKSNALLVT